MREPDPESANYGIAVTSYDYEKGEIIDSDIFMFSSEFRKLLYEINEINSDAGSKTVKKLKISLLHELGHLLGLDHQFTKDIQSVMSYRFDREPKLYDYDTKAIQALYY